MGIWKFIKGIVDPSSAGTSDTSEGTPLFDGLVSPDKAPAPKDGVSAGFPSLDSDKTTKSSAVARAQQTRQRPPQQQQRHPATKRTPKVSFRDARTRPLSLQQLGLPVWNRPGEIAKAVGVSWKRLHRFSTYRTSTTSPAYHTFTIPKRRGGERTIMAPNPQLKFVQRQLNKVLISKLPVSDYAHGFREARSIRTAAEPHVGKQLVVTLDLIGFFDAVTFSRVRGLLISVGYDDAVAATVAALTTESVRRVYHEATRTVHVAAGPRTCVQGAPTSPGLCNAVARRMDLRLAGLARSLDMSYTRYADDLTFSGDNPSVAMVLVQAATRIIEEEGFVVNEAKTRIARASSHQRVVGVTVNEVLGLSRKERRKIRAALHQARLRGASEIERRRLEGKLAFVSMLNEKQAEKLRAR